MTDSYVGYAPANRLSLAPGSVSVGNLATTGTASSSTYLRGDMAWSANPLGDVVGPGSSTDDALAKYDSTTGKLLQNSNATLSDAGVLTVANIAATINTATQNSVTTMTGLTTVGTVVAGQFGTDAAPLTAFINAGEIDGNVIGSESPAAGTFTTVTVNDLLTVNAGLAVVGDTTGEITLTVTGVGSQTANLMTVEQSDGTDKLQVSAAGVTTAASLVATTADINGGTFDGVVGGTTPAAGSFTTLAGTLSTAAQNSITSATSLASVGTVTTGVWQGTDVGVAHGGTGLSAAAKGSVLIANAADTISALDGGGSNDGLLYYTASADTIAWATSLDGGTF